MLHIRSSSSRIHLTRRPRIAWTHRSANRLYTTAALPLAAFAAAVENATQNAGAAVSTAATEAAASAPDGGPIAAAAVEAVDAATNAAVDASTDFGNVGPSPILAKLAFFLAIYVTIGTIILSWDEWRRKRNSEREIAEWKAAGGAKRRWGDTGAKSGTRVEGQGLNREMRRMAKKQEMVDRRDKKKSSSK